MRRIHIAVVGSGPAGFYSAAGLLALPGFEVHVDMIERLPTPWGLVRSGVAPDHPEIKSVSTVFAKTAAHKRFRFFGNVELGKHVPRDELVDQYDAVIYATGAPRDRRLGIPGECLSGSFAATQVVGWYNGHPDYRGLEIEPHLSGRRAVIVGNGNVALDVARILAMPAAGLRHTDIADHALAALHTSRLESIVIVGRRGPLEASFTTPELRELGALDGVRIAVDPADLEHTHRDLAPTDVRVQRNLEVLRHFGSNDQRAALRTLAFRFHRSPVEIRGDNRVRGVVLTRNAPHAQPNGTVIPHDTGEREQLSADLVISTIGYNGEAIPGLPFDANSGVIPNDDGRVQHSEKEYVVGWIKRGASGVIGTNKKCARQTIETLSTDIEGRIAREREPGHSEQLARWLSARQPELVTLEQWQLIDAHERALGEASGRPRVKLCDVPDLLRVGQTRVAR